MKTYQDKFTKRVRQVRQLANRHYQIREVIAEMPSEWRTMPKREIEFVVQDCELIAE